MINSTVSPWRTTLLPLMLRGNGAALAFASDFVGLDERMRRLKKADIRPRSFTAVAVPRLTVHVPD